MFAIRLNLEVLFFISLLFEETARSCLSRKTSLPKRRRWRMKRGEDGAAVGIARRSKPKSDFGNRKRQVSEGRRGLTFLIFILYEETTRHRSSRSGSSFVTFERQRKQNALFCSRQALCLQKNVVRPTPSTRQRPSCAFTRRNSFNKTDSADADVCNRLCFSTALLPPCVHGSGSGQGCYRQ